MRSAWASLVRAVQAARRLDSAAVQEELQRMGERRRWLAPLTYAAATIAFVFEGVLILLRNWRLLLLQLAPAAWIWVMTRELKAHVFAGHDLPTAYADLVAAGVLVVAQISYWCNATFAFTVVAEEGTGIADAFRQARSHWRLVSGVALLTGSAQAAVWLFLEGHWLTVGLVTMLVVQIYMFIAVPAWLVGAPSRAASRREKAEQTLTTGVLSGVASTPGFLLNRVGLLMLGIPKVGFIGFIVLAISAVLHVTASSSVRVVKMSIRLKSTGGDSPGDPPPASPHPGDAARAPRP
jgi:hypothetical protein